MNSMALADKLIIAIDDIECKNIITTIDPIIDKRWEAFITSHPDSTIFHHSAWARVLAESYRCHPTYYVMENERHEILAAAPFLWIKSPLTGKRLVCLPHGELCFPLAYREEDLRTLMARVLEEVDGERNACLEIRGWGSLGAPQELGLKERGYFLTHVVALDDDPQKVRNGLDRNGRYNLRYAEKTPLTVRLGQNEADLREFHRLNTETRRKHNLLPQPYRFFKSIYQNLVVPGYGYFLMAELDGRVIAANMNFCFRDTIIHEFNAQDQACIEHRPNYLLIWKAMEKGCQEGYRYYDFGRTQPENQPLANFKRHWGSRETVLPYYYYPQVGGVGSVSRGSLVYRAHTAVNKCLPGFMLGVVGDFLHRHMG